MKHGARDFGCKFTVRPVYGPERISTTKPFRAETVNLPCQIHRRVLHLREGIPGGTRRETQARVGRVIPLQTPRVLDEEEDAVRRSHMIQLHNPRRCRLRYQRGRDIPLRMMDSPNCSFVFRVVGSFVGGVVGFALGSSLSWW